MSQIVGLGTAQPAHVLAGETFTSGSGADQQGSMPNNGGVTLTPSGTGTVAIPAGYHDGTGKVAQVTVPAANVLAGTNIAGVVGTMPNEGSVTLTPSGTGTVQIPQGYHDGTGKVAQVTVPAANVLAGTTIAGIAGTMPENGALGTITPGTAAKSIPAGHTSGGTVAGDANLTPSNIRNGVSIFGVTGNMKRSATGQVNSSAWTNASNSQLTISGLAFTPSHVVIAAGGYSGGIVAGAYDSANLGNELTTFMWGINGYSTTISMVAGGFTLTVTGYDFGSSSTNFGFTWNAYE